MKLSGIGVDIIENSRIRKMIKNKDFLTRVFSKYEILNSKKKTNKISFFAKRFAAKEAFSKSLGTGFRNNLNFKDIIIKNDRSGKPFFYITKKMKFIIYKKLKTRKFNFFLSISDEKNYSIAFVIFQK
jgi:holo-[acyl-carrier protein] synthase